jgi:hypothetical protein
MMPRYFTVRNKPVRADYDDWQPDPFINIPNVCEHEATDTGLLDAAGDTIMRAPNPVGFIWSDE